MSEMKIDIESMLPALREQVALKLREAAASNLSYEVNNAIRKEINEYINANIVPYVKAELVRHNADIKAAIVAGVVGACGMLGAKLQENAVRQISGYDGDRMVQSFFSSLFKKDDIL